MIYQKVNLKNKNDMISFLGNHFRYSTANSWNNSTSYANNLKIYKVIPRTLQNKAYEIIEQGDIYDNINSLIMDFDRENDYLFQAGFNGRSGGYLVLYKGNRKKSDYKSFCTNCYQKNFTSIKETGKKCGRCGKNKRIDQEFYDKISFPGLSIDQGEDFSEWGLSELQERVKLVQKFDKLCDAIIKLTISYCKDFKVEEQTISIPKKIKVLVEA